jgi:nucleotide-binding universal stress UspA family protein
MYENTVGHSHSEAVADFRRARFRAKVQQIVARLRGESADLFEYEEVRRKLRAINRVPRGLQDIPIDAIVGSVGRHTDYTRTFLPRQADDQDRWAGIRLAMTGLVGLPPIEVYQIGQVYFVLDGNHRVSVARQIGARLIQAYVTEVKTHVPLSPDVRPDDLILKAEYADFMDRTGTDQLLPGVDLSVSLPGQYEKLEEHISVHRYFMGIDQGREISYEEAVVHWYDTLYEPAIGAIREQGLQRDFGDQTEADLYLWVVEHGADLAQEFGWEVGPKSAAADLADRFSSAPQRVASRIGRRILEAVTPDGLANGPPTGDWRQEHVADRMGDRLFGDILVALDGKESGWRAMSWAQEVARREQARLYGLHVVPAAGQRESEAARAVQSEFERRCSTAGISGRLTVAAGKVPRLVCERAGGTDLVVLSLSHPYAPDPLARLASGLRTIIRRCPTPVMVVPGPVTGLERMLLAYDGSSKAQEALFVAAYLAGRWGVPLVVLTVASDRSEEDALAYAQGYLEEHGIQATYVREHGPAAEMILITAEEQATDLIIVGGYGFSPIVESALGSTVGQVLRSCGWPVLICQ